MYPSMNGSRMRPEGPANKAYGQRSGILGWWLNLTAPPAPNRLVPIAEQERLRKAELTSYSILAVFALLLALVSNSFDDPATGQAVLVSAIGLVIAAVLNRTGWTRTAAYFVPSLFMAVIALAILGGGLDTIVLPAYDLFVLPVFLTSLTANQRAPWVFAFIAITFIVGDFVLQPHGLITATTTPGGQASNFDSIQYWTRIYNQWGMVNRHISLAFFAAFFGWLGARSVNAAIRRADRAEELAALEHAVGAQRQQLEVGVQQILETHVRIANGDYAARAPLSQDHLLWQISSSLNNLMGRLQKSGQAEHQLRRTEDELRRLAAAIDDAQAGKRPIWPASSGTAADLIIERISGRGRPAPGLAQGQQRPPLPPGYGPNAAYPEPQRYGGAMGQMGAMGATGGLHAPGTGPLEAPDFPVWQPSGPFSNPMQNPMQNSPQGPRTGPDGAPENPWFVTPDA